MTAPNTDLTKTIQEKLDGFAYELLDLAWDKKYKDGIDMPSDAGKEFDAKEMALKDLYQKEFEKIFLDYVKGEE